MPSVKRNLLAIAVAITLLVPAFAPNVSFAAGCECFCGKNGEGAKDNNLAADSDACNSLCAITSKKFVGCYTDEKNYPVHSARCWTKDECTTWRYTTPDGKTTIDAFPGTTIPYDCSSTKTLGTPMYYCYANSTSIDLNVPIGSVESVQGFASYVDIVYDWLLPASALIAVVMMMIGGLQYVMSRGKEKYISKGKERITNAITGIVLLLSVYVLLNLLDPRLTIMQSLKVPLLKQIVLLNKSDSCEAVKDVGYGISPSSGSCAEKGKITSVDNATANTGSWKKDDVCTFSKCADGGVCTSSGCQNCLGITNPSESTCQAAEALGSGADGSTNLFCRYNAIAGKCEGAGSSLTTTSSTGFACANLVSSAVSLFTSGIQASAALQASGATTSVNPASVSCTFYNSKVTYAPDTDGVDEAGNGIAKTVCEADPCLMSAYAGKTCAFVKDAGTGKYQCE